MKKLLIIGASSDIGSNLLSTIHGYFQIIATYNSTKVKNKFKNTKFISLNIKKKSDIDTFSKKKLIKNWDHLLILPGSLNPIGKFTDTNPDDIVKSINLNFTNQIYLINKLINLRNKNNKSSNVIVTSGPASNSANKDYFAYTISKVALIKSFELLNNEIIDVNFIVAGPGMLKTKIHEQTISSKNKSLESYNLVLKRLNEKKYNSINLFSKFLFKLIRNKSSLMGGRNISFEFDEWYQKEYLELLKNDENMHKLRRSMNNLKLNELDFNINSILSFLFENPSFQNTGSETYNLFKRLLSLKISREFNKHKKMRELFDHKINFPYIKMGNINSTHLFGIDELILLKFYHSKRNSYKNVCDIGANIGLHSTIMSKVGFKVHSFEPDPIHFKVLKKNCKNLKSIKLYNEAVSDKVGESIFTRIINNTTGSFLKDNKSAYGPVKKFKVKTNTLKNLNKKFDLLKIDAEGSEIDILSVLEKEDFKKMDVVMEISTLANRKKLWILKNKFKFNIYTQKKSWQKAINISCLPTSHREGSVFLSCKNTFI
jgi:FkbM family methyltransferase